jgi:hypothetical protein
MQFALSALQPRATPEGEMCLGYPVPGSNDETHALHRCGVQFLSGGCARP